MKKILIFVLFISFLLLLPAFSSASVNLNILEIEKEGRNLSNGETTWSKPFLASPGDVLEFKITVKTNASLENVMVRDVLPSKVSYLGNLKINGLTSSRDISSQAVNIGYLSPGETAVLTFSTRVNSADSFSMGETYLYNPALAYTDKEKTAETTASLIVISKKQVAGVSSIPTGISHNFLINSLLFPLLASLVLLWLFSSPLIGLDKLAKERQEKIMVYRSERKLRKKAEKMKNKLF